MCWLTIGEWCLGLHTVAAGVFVAVVLVVVLNLLRPRGFRGC